MREYKFRAWDTKKKEWLKDFSIGQCGTILLPVCEGCTEYDTEADRRWENNDETEIGRRILTQYTGLKDKNGKEIYEGDIVQETFTGKSIISWDVGNIQYRMTGLNGERNGFLAMGMELEVVGNIYEQPELLKANP